MTPFKKGFVEKCAEYGIEKEQAKELFKKVAYMQDPTYAGLAALPGLAALAAGTGAGAYNYSQHGQGGRALLSGMGTMAGMLPGAIVGGGIGGLAGAMHTSPNEDPLPFLTGVGAGNLVGAPVGGYLGYQAGDWLGTPSEEKNKVEKQGSDLDLNTLWNRYGNAAIGGGIGALGGGALGYGMSGEKNKGLGTGIGALGGGLAGAGLGHFVVPTATPSAISSPSNDLLREIKSRGISTDEAIDAARKAKGPEVADFARRLSNVGPTSTPYEKNSIVDSLRAAIAKVGLDRPSDKRALEPILNMGR